MPDRIIRESICTSDTLDKLNWFEEVFWHRLVVNCDDFGRFDARPEVLRSRLFPLKEGKVTKKTVDDALNTLATVGLVFLYECDGKPYLQLVTWEKYQRRRANKSKYPNPPLDSAVNCCQLTSNVSVFENRESNTNTHNLAEGFKTFWDAYPKKKSKGDAEKAFKAINPDDQLLGAIIAAVKKQLLSRDWQKDGGQFIPYPASWLRAKGWEDEDVSVQEERRILTYDG